MTDRRFKLTVVAAITLLSMLAALLVSLIGLVKELPPETILAVALVFSQGVTAGIGYFVGHANGVGEKNNGSM